jgi:hypothetical protein
VAWQLVQQLYEPLKQHVLIIVYASLFSGMEEADGAHIIQPQGLDILEKARLEDIESASLLPTSVLEKR